MQGLVLRNGFDIKFDYFLVPLFIVIIYLLIRKAKLSLSKVMFVMAGGILIVSVLLFIFNNNTFPLIFYSLRLADWSYYFLLLAITLLIFNK